MVRQPNQRYARLPAARGLNTETDLARYWRLAVGLGPCGPFGESKFPITRQATLGHGRCALGVSSPFLAALPTFWSRGIRLAQGATHQGHTDYGFPSSYGPSRRAVGLQTIRSSRSVRDRWSGERTASRAWSTIERELELKRVAVSTCHGSILMSSRPQCAGEMARRPGRDCCGHIVTPQSWRRGISVSHDGAIVNQHRRCLVRKSAPTAELDQSGRKERVRIEGC